MTIVKSSRKPRTIPKVSSKAGRPETVRDLVSRLGDIPLNRIRLVPAPGTATEKDLADHRFCELVDGVLVEVGMGYTESRLAIWLSTFLAPHVFRNNLGIVSGADGTIRFFPGLVRIPDVAFTSWERFPRGKSPKESISPAAPDLAVEVLSQSNTKKEMIRKRREYFDAGVRVVWMIDPKKRTVDVYTSATEFRTFTAADTIDAGDVVPGFTLSLPELFAELDRKRRPNSQHDASQHGRWP